MEANIKKDGKGREPATQAEGQSNENENKLSGNKISTGTVKHTTEIKHKHTHKHKHKHTHTHIP